MFIIMKGAAFVAKPGSCGSYTRSLPLAHKYATREEAEKNVCPENERVVDLERFLEQARR